MFKYILKSWEQLLYSLENKQFINLFEVFFQNLVKWPVGIYQNLLSEFRNKITAIFGK